jgi:hypothetical protein
MKMSNLYRMAVVLTGTVGPVQALAEASTVFVPPGLENTEGSNSLGSHSPPASGFRMQDRYLASEFSSLPNGQGVLVGLAWRPDRTVRGPREILCADSKIWLSTNESESGDSLSRTFGHNVGADQTLVYSGDLLLETDGSGPSAGPRGLDYVVEFDSRFNYDPSQGDLLVDWSCGPGSWGAPQFDAETTPGSRRMTWAWSPSASSAADERDAVRVVQFRFQPDTPLQAGDADQDLDFDQFDLIQVQIAGKYLTEEPATWGEGDWNSAPGGSVGDPPVGDGVFNQRDIVVAQQAAIYFTGAYAGLHAEGLVATVPEPSTFALAALGLTCLLAGRRRGRR